MPKEDNRDNELGINALVERHREKIDDALRPIIEEEFGEDLSFEEYERRVLEIMNEIARRELERKLQKIQHSNRFDRFWTVFSNRYRATSMIAISSARDPHPVKGHDPDRPNEPTRAGPDSRSEAIR